MKICIKCGNEMKVRVSKKGFDPGSLFLGCSTYPKCLNTEHISFSQPLNPEDIHRKIFNFTYSLYGDQTFFIVPEDSLNTLLYQLHFANYKSFYTWALNEMTKNDPHSMHNGHYLTAASFYCFHLANIFKSLKIIIDTSDEINKLIVQIFGPKNEYNSRKEEWSQLIA